MDFAKIWEMITELLRTLWNALKGEKILPEETTEPQK